MKHLDARARAATAVTGVLIVMGATVALVTNFATTGTTRTEQVAGRARPVPTPTKVVTITVVDPPIAAPPARQLPAISAPAAEISHTAEEGDTTSGSQEMREEEEHEESHDGREEAHEAEGSD